MSAKKSSHKIEYYVPIGIGIIFLLASVTSLIFSPGSFLCYVFLALGAGLITIGIVEHSKSKVVAVPRKLRLGSKYVNVYEKTNFDSPVVAELKEGDEIKVGEKEEANGVSWFQVLLPDGRKGYAFAEFEVYRVLSGRTESPKVVVYQEPNRNSSQIAVLPAGSNLDICEEHWMRRYTDIQWILVWLPDGQSGFVQRPIKVKWESNPPK